MSRGYHPRAAVLRRRMRRDAAKVRWLDDQIARTERRVRAMRRLAAFFERRIMRDRAEIADLIAERAA